MRLFACRSRPGESPSTSIARLADDSGQAVLLTALLLLAIVFGAIIFGAFAAGSQTRDGAQRAADLAALSGGRAMLREYPRVFAPQTIEGKPNPAHLSLAAYLAIARRTAQDTARQNGAVRVTVAFPDARPDEPPLAIQVTTAIPVDIAVAGERRRTEASGSAEAQVSPTAGAPAPGHAAGGGYAGPLAYRQGRPMRPDVAMAFDRMERKAGADGVGLIVTSGFRSDAEQAILWARNPNPKWVAPPGKSLHRLGTELDLGPPAAYGWLAANAPGFGFLQRYSWEPWHWGYAPNPHSRPEHSGGDGRSAVPSFVPTRYVQPIAEAAQRYSVSATLLAAQLKTESEFNPRAVSKAGAQGIAQFMPGTARAYGLVDAFDAEAAIDAQARLMRDLLRRFGAVNLALAAYNAGAGAVEGCMCIPGNNETPGYVAHINALMGGAGELATGAAPALEVRLVR